MRKRIRERKKHSNEAGFILISLYMVLAVMVLYCVGMISQARAEAQAVQMNYAAMQSMYLAEGALDQSLVQLRNNYAWSTGFGATNFGEGNYTVTVQNLGNRKRITAQGTSSMLQNSVNRSLEMIVQEQIPEGFYDNAIWTAQELTINGNAYAVNGDITHADPTPTGDFGNVTGSTTYDPVAAPLPLLDFQQLYDIANSQNNVYDAARLSGGSGVFPGSFWYTPPTDPLDPTTGVPNVNYVTTDLVLNGNIGTVGGFFVVVGNVLSDPSAVQDSTINGNGQIDGTIYTTGDFRINGGGGGLNVNGGVWSGDEARLNGNATITYNADYMAAIEALDINADVQIVSWQDLN